MTAQDEDHLRLLSIFHYVYAGITCFFGSIPLIHVTMGIALMVSPPEIRNGQPQPDLRFIGAIFAVIGGLAVLLSWSFGAGLFFAGRNLASRRRYTFCFVIACIACIFVPIGTSLGVCSILVLLRPAVKAAFDLPAIEPADEFTRPALPLDR